MSTKFEATLIQIGNSVGVTIPKRVADVYPLGTKVSVEIDFEAKENEKKTR